MSEEKDMKEVAKDQTESTEKVNEQAEKSQNKRKEEYTTDMNDPDLLVGPYKPTEDEPPTIKCPNCGEEMPITIDTCVCCGHYLKSNEKRYKPMDENKAKKIRWTLGIIFVVAFIIYMIVTNV